MRLELTRVGLLVKLANHYTTRGALSNTQWLCAVCVFLLRHMCIYYKFLKVCFYIFQYYLSCFNLEFEEFFLEVGGGLS